MRELLVVVPELPLLALVVVVAVLSRRARRYVAGACVGLVVAVVLGVLARQLVMPGIDVCRVAVAFVADALPRGSDRVDVGWTVQRPRPPITAGPAGPQVPVITGSGRVGVP